MSKLLDELEIAERHITNACGYQSGCKNCPMGMSAGMCVLVAIQQAVKTEYLNDLRRQNGEVI